MGHKLLYSVDYMSMHGIQAVCCSKIGETTIIGGKVSEVSES